MNGDKSGREDWGVLQSYRKVGHRFIPPMLQKFRFDDISWLSQTMPELVWWDIVISRGSLRFAARLAEEIALHFKAIKNRDRWWVFTSDFSTLTEEMSHAFRQRLIQAKLLNELQGYLAPFLGLYPACPLARVLDRLPTGESVPSYLLQFENRLRILENKRSRDGVLAQAQCIYVAAMSGRLHVRQGLALAEFPEVSRYPDTEQSLKVGASICAAVNMIAGQALPTFKEDEWVQYFWKRSLELHPLNLKHLER